MKKRGKTESQQCPEPLTQTETVLKPIGPTIEQIQRRAYELYQARGGSDGRDWDDWLLAEYQLRAESGLEPRSSPTAQDSTTPDPREAP